jgi:hypothetical protein
MHQGHSDCLGQPFVDTFDQKSDLAAGPAETFDTVRPRNYHQEVGLLTRSNLGDIHYKLRPIWTSLSSMGIT